MSDNLQAYSEKIEVKRDDTTTWATVSGSFQTNEKCKIKFSLPGLWDTCIVKWTAHITNQKSNYDMIIGRDVLTDNNNNTILLFNVVVVH